MIENTFENNVAVLHGIVAGEAKFSHDIYGEGFYSFNVSVERLSNSYDDIPVMVSERLLSLENIKMGRKITVFGQFRSYNDTGANKKNRLVLSFFVREIELDKEFNGNSNFVELDGYLCKPPIFRTTPSGREIADVLLAVNRSYNKSDYIPCIVWGRNARYCSNLKVGTQIKIDGRIQSRKYQKRYDSGEVETKVAYEVSVSKLAVKNKN